MAGYKINSHADDLNCAMEKFINFMTNLTLESLKLEESRTRARAANREDNLVDLEAHLMNSMEAVTTNLDSVTHQMELLMDAVSQYNHLNPPAEPEPQPHDAGHQAAPAPAKELKFEPKESFLSHRKGKQFFDSNTMIVNEDDFEILELYLVSGGSNGTTDLIERYAFQTLDRITKEDYKTMKAKILLEGGRVEGIAGVLRCLRSTIRERRSLYRLRSDYLTEHLHTQKIALFGNKGERINLSMKNL